MNRVQTYIIVESFLFSDVGELRLSRDSISPLYTPPPLVALQSVLEYLPLFGRSWLVIETIDSHSSPCFHCSISHSLVSPARNRNWSRKKETKKKIGVSPILPTVTQYYDPFSVFKGRSFFCPGYFILLFGGPPISLPRIFARGLFRKK